MSSAKVMFVQWGGERQVFYSDKGVVVITKTDDGWIFKTAFGIPDFDDVTLQILEVIQRYVK